MRLKKDKLKTFVEALNGLPDEIKGGYADMASNLEPSDTSCGCHAGLVSMAAESVPELKKIGLNLLPDYHLNDDGYSYEMWAKALGEYLGFNSVTADETLECWMAFHPEIWGNEWGGSMFYSGGAFDKSTEFVLHQAIIDHWTKVWEKIK